MGAGGPLGRGKSRFGRRPILGSTFVALAVLSCPLALGEDLRIGRITIRSLDVFTSEEAQRGWLYTAANAVHITTRPSLVRKFLLFREGDPYRPALLAETERNLRALRFLKSASVVAGPPHGGVVDVEITTQDSWTTQPGLSFGGKGGVTTFGAAFEEKNFLGSGRGITVAYDKGTDRTNRLLSFRDPQLFGPYWNGEVTYASNSDGRQERLEVSRPFSSFTAPWATALEFDHLTQDLRLYQAGRVASRFREERRELSAEYGIALRASEKRAERLTLGFQSLEENFAHLTDRPGDRLPEDRRFRYLFLEYESVRNDFLKLNYVNRDLRYEDFNLGLRFVARVGLSPSLFGLDETTALLRVAGEDGWRLGAQSFLRAALSLETRWERVARNTILSAWIGYVRKFDTRLLQTMVARISFDRGWDLDRDVQFFADGATGLRAYRLHAFEGDKRLIANVEHRIFFGKELFQLVSPGAAVFFDAGTAAPPGVPIRLSEIRSDVGVGLRLGIPRATSNNVFRLDLAYALSPDPRGRRGLLVSFSSSQAF